MFIFSLTYVKPLSEVERLLPAHIQFLDEHYKKHLFMCSGRKIPRTGGIILCNCADMAEAKAMGILEIVSAWALKIPFL